MGLSSDLISQFVKITNDDIDAQKETTSYGTILTDSDNKLCVRLDGDKNGPLIPISSKSAQIKENDRVIVSIKNHTVTITGNLDAPAVRAENEAINIDDINKTVNDFGSRVQIFPSSYNILSQNGDILASYGEKLIELGKNSSEAVISLCGSKGLIEFDADEDYLQINGDYLRLKGDSAASLYSNYYDHMNFGQRSAINVSPGSIYLYSQESANIDPDTMVGVWNTSTLTFDSKQFNLLTDSIKEMSRYGSTYSTVSGNITLHPNDKVHSKTTILVSTEDKTRHNDGKTGWYIGSDGTMHATHATGGPVIGFHFAGSTDYTSIIRETKSGVITINGFEYASNKVLWSGEMHMSASQKAELSEAISDQTNGIVLVFSRYSSDTAQNYHFHTYFVPKGQIAKHAGCGHTFLLSSDGSFGLFAAKYLYINDTNIVGNDINIATGEGTCGIKYTNNGFVLRHVIGV
jgi:hypothetical protein